MMSKSEGSSYNRLWVRLPNWLGDVVMAAPILRALRDEQPEAEITLLGQPALAPFMERLEVSDQFIALPEKGTGYFRFFRGQRRSAPDACLLFTNSLRSDMEAFLAACPQRLGMRRRGKPRPLLTRSFKLAKDIDESEIHQTKHWVQMVQSFGLATAPYYSPFSIADTKKSDMIGLICGTENSPEKRWPIERWRELIAELLAALPAYRIALFGTPNDRQITARVSQGFDENRVANLAGETNLVDFCDALNSCALVCCNDTGGMHLANLHGTPLVAVFGPTNPVRTGPVFEADHVILQPEGCPPTGGMPIDGVSVQTCLDAMTDTLASNRL